MMRLDKCRCWGDGWRSVSIFDSLLVVDEGQIIGRFELCQVKLGLYLENTINLSIWAHIKAYHGVWYDLPSIFVPNICNSHVRGGIAFIFVDYDISLRIDIQGKLPPLPNVPTSFNIDRMFQASKVQGVVEDTITAIELLHTWCLQNRFFLQLVGSLPQSFRKCD